MKLPDSGYAEFELVYEAYADQLYRVALSTTGRREDAEDAVHDVFLKYLETKPTFHSDEHRRAWLIRVTVNRCRDILRRHKVRVYLSMEEAGDIPASPDDFGGNRVLYYISLLPPKYRSAIVLHHLENYSVEKISEMLGVTASAVKMRLSRGRDALKEIMEKEEYHV